MKARVIRGFPLTHGLAMLWVHPGSVIELEENEYQRLRRAGCVRPARPPKLKVKNERVRA